MPFSGPRPKNRFFSIGLAVVAASLLLGLVAVFGGMLFLSLYLLWLSYRCRGDARAMLLGPVRAQG